MNFLASHFNGLFNRELSKATREFQRRAIGVTEAILNRLLTNMFYALRRGHDPFNAHNILGSLAIAGILIFFYPR